MNPFSLVEIQFKDDVAYEFSDNKLLFIYPTIVNEKRVEAIIREKSPQKVLEFIRFATEVNKKTKSSIVMVILPPKQRFKCKGNQIFNFDDSRPRIFRVTEESQVISIKYWIRGLNKANKKSSNENITKRDLHIEESPDPDVDEEKTELIDDPDINEESPDPVVDPDVDEEKAELIEDPIVDDEKAKLAVEKVINEIPEPKTPGISTGTGPTSGFSNSLSIGGTSRWNTVEKIEEEISRSESYYERQFEMLNQTLAKGEGVLDIIKLMDTLLNRTVKKIEMLEKRLEELNK